MRERTLQLSSTTNQAGRSINYAEGPDSGSPLVLLHGLTTRWQVFLPLCPTLCEQWHVFAPDFRGHGKSTHVHDAYRGGDYAADVITFLEQCVARPAIVFGHSLGGMVALHIAATKPELVSALVLGDNPISVESLLHSHYPTLFRAVLELKSSNIEIDHLAKCLGEIRVQLPDQCAPIRLNQVPGNDEAFLRSWARSVSEMDSGALRMSLDGSASVGWRGHELLPAVECPTLLIQANPALGGLMSDEDVIAAQSSLEHLTYVKLDSLGHQLYIQDPAPVLRALTNFLVSL